jgi:hypothetical protein
MDTDEHGWSFVTHSAAENAKETNFNELFFAPSRLCETKNLFTQSVIFNPCSSVVIIKCFSYGA